MNKFVLATKNSNKFNEICKILPQYNFVMLDNNFDDISETGSSFEENAVIKAKYVVDKLGKAAIADDSGLEVDAINGEPGIKSARYAGENASDNDRNNLLLENLKNVKNRSAKMVCALACVFPNGNQIIVRGECFGEITYAPSGNNGFGYDPIFRIDTLGKTLAELSQEEKGRISHRAVALEKLKKELCNFLC